MMSNYYSLDLVSQSRLSIVKCLVEGKSTSFAKAETLEFGRLLHEYILEPGNYDCNNPYHERLRAMGSAAKKNILLSFILSHTQLKVEEEHFFVHTRTQQQCKMKLDARLFNAGYDLKTTACESRDDFENTVTEYGYHRQAAFYIDGAELDKFTFIGINKKHPYKTFTFCLEKNDARVLLGREEYEHLLDEHLRLKNEGVDFQNL
jgi:hypothetical protein